MKIKLIALIICFLPVVEIANGQTDNNIIIKQIYREALRTPMAKVEQPKAFEYFIDTLLLFNPLKVSLNVRHHIIGNIASLMDANKYIFDFSDYEIIPDMPSAGHPFQVNYSVDNFGLLVGTKVGIIDAEIYLNGVLQDEKTNNHFTVPRDSTQSGTFRFTLPNPGTEYQLKLYLRNHPGLNQPTSPLIDSAEVDFSVSQNFSLTGLWMADDGGTYYVSQQGDTLWWAGMSDDNGLQNGLTFSNIFKGNISGDLITGDWADVPRGTSMNSGSMTLKIIFDNAGNPTALQKQSSVGMGFGALHWDKQFGDFPKFGGSWFNSFLFPVDLLFRIIYKNTYDNGWDQETLRERLDPIKDATVIYGKLISGSPTDHLALSTRFPSDWPRDWDHFHKLQDPNLGAQQLDPADPEGQKDADMEPILEPHAQTFVQIDTVSLPHDFYNGMIPKHEEFVKKNLKTGVHPEMVMFANPSNKNQPSFLPGWADKNGNSVLINGHPLNGDCSITADGKISSFFDSLSLTMPTAFISPHTNDNVRITGAMVDDPGHDEGIFEIHPVYAMDLIHPTAGNLSGTWGDKEGCTYYIHQVNNSVWVLITKPLRDYSFAAVFEGEMKGELLSGITITGNWSAIPYGYAVGSGSLSFSLDLNLITMTIAGDLPLAGRVIRKLYDAPH